MNDNDSMAPYVIATIVCLAVIGMFLKCDYDRRRQPASQIGPDTYVLPAIGFESELARLRESGREVKSITSKNEAVYGQTSAYIVVLEPVK